MTLSYEVVKFPGNSEVLYRSPSIPFHLHNPFMPLSLFPALHPIYTASSLQVGITSWSPRVYNRICAQYRKCLDNFAHASWLDTKHND